MTAERSPKKGGDAPADPPAPAPEKPRRSRSRKRPASRKGAPDAEEKDEAGESGPEAESGGDALDLPEDQLIVLPARNMLLFPRVVLPIVVGREPSVRAIQAAVQGERPIGVLLQRRQEQERPRPEDLHSVGTVAAVVRYITAPDGTHHVIAQGEERFRVLEYVRTEPFLVARVERLPEVDDDDADEEIQARLLNLKGLAHQALSFLAQKPEDLDQAIDNATSPSGLTDLVATFMDIPVEEKQEILETIDLRERMDTVAEKLTHLVQVLRISHEIRQKTQGKMDKAQREYYLREQLRQIQKELGEGQSVELQDLREAVEGSKMPADVKKEARRELERLERMPEAAAEHGMLRSYLELLVELPWGKRSRDKLDVERARQILDEDHYGLDKVKKRILEFLAVRKLKPDGKSPILCFVGPPGVGKTSLGRSIARAMGRAFVRTSLGGVHDESEIRGHRRTYVGSMPGGVIQQIRKAGSANPVFMLDEMDKLGQGFHGDPASALLEVLDPEQNRAFVDHYLNVPFDLSRVMFIATANVLDAIPGPLRDRCEVIHLPGYTHKEKFEIGRRYLVGRQLEANGLKAGQLELPDETLDAIIRSYTREAGVRNLEREIGGVARHAATRIASGLDETVRVGPEDLATVLGPVRFESELALRTSRPGVATGLAWTPTGGEILFVEAAHMPGRGELILTGQLGDVMRESARAAISLVKSNLDELGLEAEFFEGRDIHVHVPAGAIPKDGPSAGVALYAALVSLLTGRSARSDTAMTGEISLRGLVLPIGGVKEKVLAAQQAGIRRVLLPARNEKDFEDVPEDTRKALEFVWIRDVRQLLEEALEAEETGEAGADGAGSDKDEDRGRGGARISAAAERDEG